MAVSTYSYDSLPPDEQEGLPSAEQIAAALDRPESDSPSDSVVEGPRVGGLTHTPADDATVSDAEP